MDAQAKQQVVERVKQATNILVTVSNNPSVDQLAACIGLTLLLNKMGKHATAVFSGQVPSTIEFLQPEKTIETNTDSLRDFIISLDKAKADKLRYKVEDQYVRIFITPYRTSISDKDLQFSQGEYNVEAVVALGVKDAKQLDAAITAHGKILHDATVISVNSGSGQAPKLGQVNWQDATASSLSEMVVSISEAFGSNLLDGQMSTAFLTGIVAETERFSNPKTSPKVMTMSAQLMAAGANQQLIVSKLEPPPPEPAPAPPASAKEGDQKPKAAAAAKLADEPKKNDGTLTVDHGGGNVTPVNQEVNVTPDEIAIDNEGTLRKAAELLQAQQKVEAAQAASPIAKNVEPPKPVEPEPAKPEDQQAEPAQAHSIMNGGPSEPAFTASTQPESEDNQATTDPLAESDRQNGFLSHAQNVTPPPENEARNAVDAALSAGQEGVAPPPFPPPLSPTQGVVIPPPPIDPNNPPQNASPTDNTL